MTTKNLFIGTTESASLKAPVEVLHLKKFKLGHRWILICKLAEPITIETIDDKISCEVVYLVDRNEASGKTLMALNHFPYDCYVYYEVRSDILRELQKVGRNGMLLWGKLYNNFEQAKRNIDQYQEGYKEYF